MIKINQLQYRYSGSRSPALNDVTLAVKRGSLFGLLGPNGAGKTTLMSIISGQRQCPRASVFIDGSDIAASGNSWKACMSLVPQEYAFYERLSIAENLAFFAAALGLPRSQRRSAIAGAAQMTGLSDRMDNRAAQLSGGLKRRLNLAIGLLNRPSLLLLDEPTVGIDPHSRRFILDTIRELNRQGTTVVYTSHYMEEVETLCEEIAIIDHGRVLCQGSMESLLASDDSNILSLELDGELSQAQFTELKLAGPFDPACRHIQIDVSHFGSLEKALSVLGALQLDIKRMHYGAQNLEELFMNLTHHSLRD